MAVYIEAENPKKLLDDFDHAITLGNSSGGVATWVKEPNGTYTHTSNQWGSDAFFQPIISGNRLAFYLIKPQGKTVSAIVYGYYHGHLIETMLNHFDQQFTIASATALPTPNDRLI